MKLTRALYESTLPHSIYKADLKFLWEKYKPPSLSPSKIEINHYHSVENITFITLVYNNKTFTGMARRSPTDSRNFTRAEEVSFVQAVKKLFLYKEAQSKRKIASSKQELRVGEEEGYYDR